jgi:hypothetical protein
MGTALAVVACAPETRALVINKHFDEAHKFGGKCSYHRLQASRELVAARAVIEPGKWIVWCKANIKRGTRDIQQVMKMASAPDPEKALGLENKRAADGMREARNITRIAATEDVDLEEQALVLFHQMSTEQKGHHVVTVNREVTVAPDTPAVAAIESVDLIEQALALFHQMSSEQKDHCIAAIITEGK